MSATQYHIHVGRPRVYLTRAQQWDRPTARLTLRVSVTAGDGQEAFVQDARAAWTSEHVPSWRLAVLRVLIPWLTRLGGGTLDVLSGVAWTWEESPCGWLSANHPSNP